MDQPKKSVGRKALPPGERKKQLLIYPKQSDIDACGGEDAAREIANAAIEKAANKKK